MDNNHVSDPIQSSRPFIPLFSRQIDSNQRRIRNLGQSWRQSWRQSRRRDAVSSSGVEWSGFTVVSAVTGSHFVRRSRRQRDLGRELVWRRHFRLTISTCRRILTIAVDTGSLNHLPTMHYITVPLSDVEYMINQNVDNRLSCSFCLL